MNKLIFAILVCLSGLSQAQVTSITPPLGNVFCLSSAPTVPVPGASFVTSALVNPISNAANVIELTDGIYFYVITMTTGTGLVTSLPSCPIRYTTQR